MKTALHRMLVSMLALMAVTAFANTTPPARAKPYQTAQARTGGRVEVAPHIVCLRHAIAGSERYQDFKTDMVAISVGDTASIAGTLGAAGSVVPTEFKREIVDVLIALGFIVPTFSDAEDRSPNGYQNRIFTPLLVEVSLSGFDALNRQYTNALNGGVGLGGGRGIFGGRAEHGIELAEGSLRAVAQLSRNAQVVVGGKQISQFHALTSAPIEVKFRMRKVSTQLGASVAIGISLGNDHAETVVQGPNKAAIAAVRFAVREALRDYFEIPLLACRSHVAAS